MTVLVLNRRWSALVGVLATFSAGLACADSRWGWFAVNAFGAVANLALAISRVDLGRGRIGMTTGAGDHLRVDVTVGDRWVVAESGPEWLQIRDEGPA